MKLQRRCIYCNSTNVHKAMIAGPAGPHGNYKEEYWYQCWNEKCGKESQCVFVVKREV